MEGSKLIQLIKTFNAKEIRECGEWLQSPIINKNKTFTELYFYLKNCAPNYAPEKLKREQVYALLFPRQKYDERKMNHCMSFLLKLMEQYLAFSDFSSNELLVNIYTLRAYTHKKLKKHYAQTLESTQKKIGQYPYRNKDFYYYQYLLADTENENFLQQKIRKYDARLQNAADHFDNFILANKLKYFCEMQDRKMTLAADYQLHLKAEIRAYLQQYHVAELPGIHVYQMILNLLEHPEEVGYFFSLKKLLLFHHNAFPEAEIKDLYFYFINYCIRKINHGHTDFLKELFDIYQTCLKNNLLLDNGKLSPYTYKNIIGVALRLNQSEWVKNFIAENTKLLTPEFRDNAFHYNMAEYYYSLQDFSNAISHLNQVAFSDIYYSFDTKKMMLKIYFQLNEIDALYSLISSFQMFIRRNKSVSEANKMAYKNFIHVIQLFIKHRHEKKATEIQQALENLAPLADKKWLTEQYQLLFKN